MSDPVCWCRHLESYHDSSGCGLCREEVYRHAYDDTLVGRAAGGPLIPGALYEVQPDEVICFPDGTWRRVDGKPVDPGYATENVTAATPDELEALASWGDAIRWVTDREPCSCACHQEEAVAVGMDGPILQEDVDDYYGGVVPPGRWIE
jgi:hypothetical protein